MSQIVKYQISTLEEAWYTTERSWIALLASCFTRPSPERTWSGAERYRLERHLIADNALTEDDEDDEDDEEEEMEEEDEEDEEEEEDEEDEEEGKAEPAAGDEDGDVEMAEVTSSKLSLLCVLFCSFPQF